MPIELPVQCLGGVVVVDVVGRYGFVYRRTCGCSGG